MVENHDPGSEIRQEGRLETRMNVFDMNWDLVQSGDARVDHSSGKQGPG